ncbi:MAG TPA: hypothetical protein VKE97_02600 [Acidimicrobiia bacterium]|nr:hypothetical protein [Acidimicrobiia bacterium]
MAGTTQRPHRPGWVRRTWHRVAYFHGRLLGQTIPPLDEIDESIDKRVAAGASEDDVVTDVVEDFERSAATVSARTTPLVPASGIIVAGATFLAKDGELDSTIVAAFAIGMALLGLGFLAMSVFTHAGRPRVGLPPVRGDIAFVHARLTKKESNADVGSFLSLVGFVALIINVL